MSAYAQVDGQSNTTAMLIAAVTQQTYSNFERRRLMPVRERGRCGRESRRSSCADEARVDYQLAWTTSVTRQEAPC